MRSSSDVLLLTTPQKKEGQHLILFQLAAASMFSAHYHLVLRFCCTCTLNGSGGMSPPPSCALSHLSPLMMLVNSQLDPTQKKRPALISVRSEMPVEPQELQTQSLAAGFCFEL